LALLPESLVALVTATNTARLVRRWGHRGAMRLGLAAGSAGLITLGVTVPVSYAAMVIPLMLLGFSFGLVVTAASDLVLSSASADRAGAATGISETAFELGNALGIALTGSAISVLYLIITGTAANFTEAVDPAAFTNSLAVNCVLGGVVLAALTAVVVRVLRDPV
jgi:DHA2 family multidrug resistance protein-like MFS transporter